MSTDLINPVHDDALKAVIYPDPDAVAMAANAKTLAYSILTIENDAACLEAQSILAEVKAFREAVEARKTEVKAAPLDLCRRIDNLVRPVIADLDTAVNAITMRLTAWAALQETRRREAQQAAQASVEQGRTPEFTPELVRNLAEPVVKVKTRTTTEYRIADHTKIPVEMLELKTAAVKEYIKATGQIPPGVEVVKEKKAV